MSLAQGLSFPRGSLPIWPILVPLHWHRAGCLLQQWGLWLPSGLQGSGDSVNKLSNALQNCQLRQAPVDCFLPSTIYVGSTELRRHPRLSSELGAQEAGTSVMWWLLGSSPSLSSPLCFHYNPAHLTPGLLTNPLSLV